MRPLALALALSLLPPLALAQPAPRCSLEDARAVEAPDLSELTAKVERLFDAVAKLSFRQADLDTFVRVSVRGERPSLPTTPPHSALPPPASARTVPVAPSRFIGPPVDARAPGSHELYSSVAFNGR